MKGTAGLVAFSVTNGLASIQFTLSSYETSIRVVGGTATCLGAVVGAGLLCWKAWREWQGRKAARSDFFDHDDCQ